MLTSHAASYDNAWCYDALKQVENNSRKSFFIKRNRNQEKHLTLGLHQPFPTELGWPRAGSKITWDRLLKLQQKLHEKSPQCENWPWHSSNRLKDCIVLFGHSLLLVNVVVNARHRPIRSLRLECSFSSARIIEISPLWTVWFRNHILTGECNSWWIINSPV